MGSTWDVNVNLNVNVNVNVSVNVNANVNVNVNANVNVNVNVNGGTGLTRLIEVSIILLLPRLVTQALSAEARDFSISALGIFIFALSRSVSALSDPGLKRGKIL